MRINRRYHSLTSKIKSCGELLKIISRLKMEGKKIVFTNGCFDLLHLGHVEYLELARKKGDILIVALNSDSSVKKIKGPRRPLVNQRDRARVIAALESVDYVTIFKESTPLRLITKLKPDCLVKGADWAPDKIIGAREVLGQGGKIYCVKLSPGHSTSALIKKIVHTFSG